MTTSAYPLSWPANWPRTPHNQTGYSRFDTSLAEARDNLMKEIRLLGGSYVVLSTNIPLKNDGMPYGRYAQLSDTGVAVYFKYSDNQMCFACDKYYGVEENMQAIRKTIEALRGIERWGASDMMARAFSGFAQLPSPEGSVSGFKSKKRHWREVFELDEHCHDLEYVEFRYKKLASKSHPDKEGGSQELMAELNIAWQEAQEALNG